MAVNVEANCKRRLRSFPNSSFKVLALGALKTEARSRLLATDAKV
jgi:hypothetical protein